MESSYRVIKRNEIKLDDDAIEVKEVILRKNEIEEVIETNFEIDEENEEFEEALSIKQKILREAEEERNSILQKTFEEIEDIKRKAIEEGYKKGYDKGYSVGKDEAYKEAQDIKLNAINLLKNAQKEREEYFINFKEEIIKLSATIAEKLANISIDTSDENILNIIYPILEEMENESNIIITVNPSKYEFVKKHLPKLREEYKNLYFTILKDSDIENNGFIIESGNRIIDAQFRTQITSIINELINSGD